MSREKLTKGVIFPFPLDEKIVQIDQPLIYRPWGTRTLKIRATTNKDMPALWVRPHGVHPEDLELGIYKAYADDSEAFHITWGVGMSRGHVLRQTMYLKHLRPAHP